MNKEQAKQYFDALVEKAPTATYRRLKEMFGTEFRTFTTGFEKAPQSRRLMSEFLTDKAAQSGDIAAFIKNF